MAINVSEVEQYIRRAAQQRGIDPNVAVRVARSEGLAPGVWQSNYRKGGYREPSYGPFQLLVGGKGTGFPTGMGNDFMRQTGLDPRDPSTVNQQIDFALDHAARNGWGAWYGAAKVGVGNRDGIGGARAVGVSPVSAPGMELPETGPELAFAPRAELASASGFDPFSLLISQANAAPAPVQDVPTLNAPVSDPGGLLDRSALTEDPYEALARQRVQDDAAYNNRGGSSIDNMLAGMGEAPPADIMLDPVDVQGPAPTGDPNSFNTLSILQDPSLSGAPNVPFVDQTPLASLPHENLTFLGDNGTPNPAAPVITGDGIDTFTARPMPAQMGAAPVQGGPVGVGSIGPDGNPVLPNTAPVPTSNPTTAKTGFNLTNVLGALGGLLAAFDQGSPELKAVSLPGYAHKPQNTNVPIPRGLL